MDTNDQEGLGRLLGEFGWNKSRAKTVLWMWIFLLLLSLFLSLLIIGLPILILSIYFINRSAQRLRSNQPVILLYEQGFVDRRQGGSIITHYKDVEQIYISATVINGVLNYIVTLQTQSGKTLKIDEHVANVDHLRVALEEQVLQHQFPEAIATYQKGNPISFKLLQVDQEGLTVGKKILPWGEFGSAEIKRISNNVYLTIYQKNSKKEWAFLSRDAFPNLALFFAVTHYLQENQTY